MRIWWTLCGHAVMSIMECVNLRCRLRSNVCWHVRCFVKMLARRSYGQVRKVKLASVSICLLHPFISSHASSCHTALPWSPMTVFNILRSSSHFSTSRHSMFQEARSKDVWKYARTWAATQPEPAKMIGLHFLGMVGDARICWIFPNIYNAATRIMMCNV